MHAVGVHDSFTSYEVITDSTEEWRSAEAKIIES